MSLAQRRFLAELVANDACWGIANRVKWLHEAGLPIERDELCALLTRA